MSAQMFLNSIRNLEINNMDDEALTNVAKSLEMVVDLDTFNGATQEEAFCKLTEIREAMGVRAAAVEAKANALWQAEMKREADKLARKEKLKEQAKVKTDSDYMSDFDGGTEDDLIRLMIRSEEDGTLSFTFRGITWNWNRQLGIWDYNKPEEK